MNTKLWTKFGEKTPEEVLHLLKNGTNRDEKYHLWDVLKTARGHAYRELELAAQWARENPALCWMKQVQESKIWLNHIS